MTEKGHIKEGVIVSSQGIEGFVPLSHLIGLSEKAALAGEEKCKNPLRVLTQNNIIEGVVTNIMNFGVFEDLCDLERIIYISELSWAKEDQPGEIVNMGQKILAVVLPGQ